MFGDGAGVLSGGVGLCANYANGDGEGVCGSMLKGVIVVAICEQVNDEVANEATECVENRHGVKNLES